MSYNPQNPNGQTTSANSSPVVIASDQSAYPVTANAGTNLNTSLLALESGGNLATLAGTVAGGKINVNFASGSLPAGSNTIGNVEITDGTNTANVNAVSGKNGLYVTSNAATGSPVPSTAYYLGVLNSSGNLTGVSAAGQFGDGVTGNTSIATGQIIYNGSSYDHLRSANAAAGTTGTGLVGSGMLGYDGTNWQAAGIADTNSTTAGIAGASQLTAGTGVTTSTISLSAGTPNSNWYDMLNYAWVSVEVLTNAGGATISWQTSGDASETTTDQFAMQRAASGVSTSTTGAGQTFHGPRSGRYWRISTNLSGGNTATFVVTFFTTASQLPATFATQSGTWTVGANSATGSSFPANAFAIGASNGSGNLQAVNMVTPVDAMANTAGVVTTGENYAYNGTTWDRQRSATSASGTTGTGLLGAGAMGIYNSSAPTANSGDYYQLQLDSSANLKVNVAAGGFNFTPTTSGGVSVATSTALSNSAVAVKATAGQVYGWYIYNPNSAVSFVQFYNSTTGSTVVGTSVINPIGIPPGGASNIVAAFGIAFSTAITIAACTTAGGNTAPATALIANIYYD
ncbi:MAG TPA: hypothetical protein VGS28_00295 [Candidatus Saccharimonadales bacterium]|nr:hypothetical protein [Candidatus Saccharimonadales bacterium]